MFPRLVLASLVARRARVALALVAVTIAVALATALATVAMRVGDDLARTLRATGPNFVVLPRGGRLGFDLPGMAAAPRAHALPEGAVAAIKRSYWRHNVLAAAPEVAVAARVNGAEATVLGTWFAREVATADGPWTAGLAALRPTWRIAGRWPREDAGEIALGRALARSLDAGPGARVAIATGAGEIAATVTGVVAAGGLDDQRAWMPAATLRPLALRQGFDRVWVSALVLPPPRRPRPDPAADPRGYERFMCAAYPANVAAELATAVPGSEAVPMTEILGGEARIVTRLDRLMLLLALAALAAAALGLISTGNAGVVERARELALLAAIGAGPPQIAGLLLAETLLVALAGGGLGWLVGSALAGLIRGGTFATGAAPQALLLVPALVLALALGAIGTLGALRLALRLDPAAVLRG